MRILAQAFEWAGTAGRYPPAAMNTAFNITNGDTMVWTVRLHLLLRLRLLLRRTCILRLSGYEGYTVHTPLQAVYPRIAQLFGMESAPAKPMQLEVEMPQYASVWERIVQKHELKPISLKALVGDSWRFTDNSMCVRHAPPLSTGDLETMRDSDLPTFLIISLPIISKRIVLSNYSCLVMCCLLSWLISVTHHHQGWLGRGE